MTERYNWKGKLKPRGGLGRLESQVSLLVDKGILTSRGINNYLVVVMAGDNGISRENISIYHPMSSADIVEAHLRGEAAPAIFLQRIGKEEILVDVGLFDQVDCSQVWDYSIRRGTNNFRWEPAMTRVEAVRALEAGAQVVERLSGLDIVGLGEIGVGNTVSAAAIAASVLEVSADMVVDRGSGVDDTVLARRVEIVSEAISRHQPCKSDVVDILGKVGTFEIAAMTGFIVRAGEKGLPVMLDGYVSSVAALLASRMGKLDGVVVSHLSRERGHKTVLDALGLSPLFDFDLNYGEGMGAALGLFFCELGFAFLRKII
ncbi:MAG: nicotinate-nucleotide--dimethylbenzimidazole phosphoribosyltransferase [Syntrophothermaceae bacterium]